MRTLVLGGPVRNAVDCRIVLNSLTRGSQSRASCGPRSSCSLNWRREFRSLVPTLGQLVRIADNAPLFNYHSDNKYWDSLRGS